MPAEAAMDLETIIPDDVQARIRAVTKTDIAQVVSQISQSGIKPQEIFAFNDGPKSYRVWLE